MRVRRRPRHLSTSDSDSNRLAHLSRSGDEWGHGRSVKQTIYVFLSTNAGTHAHTLTGTHQKIARILTTTQRRRRR